MIDHYAEAERCLRVDQVGRAIAHALLALVDEFRTRHGLNEGNAPCDK